MRRRLGIIGAGSSGLAALKHAIDLLPDWDIVCWEKSDRVCGAWGEMPESFMSTSTRYTTQFTCFPKFTPAIDGHEFYRGSEFGVYLNEFADRFQLRPYIRFNTQVRGIEPLDSGWRVNLADAALEGAVEEVDALVVCTGLADKPRTSSRKALNEIEGSIVVVVGGGESAVDAARVLSETNRVFLSLRSGIRVSPRYHPVRGVPSDFLRTRLMDSVHHDIRNKLGLLFVRSRIRFEEAFRALSGAPRVERDTDASTRRKYWDRLLADRAKDQLFKTFHNKADGFLDAVAEGRIHLIGEPVDESMQLFRSLDSDDTVAVNPDEVVYCTGFRSSLDVLSDGVLRLEDFHLGCVHAERADIFLAGFCRPIIGNIPSISEMQVRYAMGVLAGKYGRPDWPIVDERKRLQALFPRLNIREVYPVEYTPYCDKLARLMSAYPTLSRVGSVRLWLKLQLLPASTQHYFFEGTERRDFATDKIHLPTLFACLLGVIKIFDHLYRGRNFKSISGAESTTAATT